MFLSLSKWVASRLQILYKSCLNTNKIIYKGYKMFSGILGNEETKKILENSIKTQKISHSYMFI